ncbi:uncharacterized protein [Pleurodeles waltl]|uniref:uncharacterized protein isoform X3 n=1 Tax=Pleurodeles waltl TaxID=8319 RepID=UPI003709B47F
MPHCFANGCKNHSDQNPFVTFHAIPKDPALVKAWTNCCSIDGVEDLVNSVLLDTTQEYYLCSEHIDTSALVFSAKNICLSSECRQQQVNYESELLPIDVQPDHLDQSVQPFHLDTRPQQVTHEPHLPSTDCRPHQVTHGPQAVFVDTEPEQVSNGSQPPAGESGSEHITKESKTLSRDWTLQKVTHYLQLNPLESTPHQEDCDMQHMPVDIKPQQVTFCCQPTSEDCAPQQITHDSQNLHLGSKSKQGVNETQILPLGCHSQHTMLDSKTIYLDTRLQDVDQKSKFLLPDHSTQCDNHNSQFVSVECKSQQVQSNTPSLFLPHRAHLLDHNYQSFSVDYRLHPADYESQSRPLVSTQHTKHDSHLLCTDCGSQHNNLESHSPSKGYRLQHMKHTSLPLSDSKSQLVNHDSPVNSMECWLQPPNDKSWSPPVDCETYHVNQDSQSLPLASTQHQISHGTKSLPMDCTTKKVKYESHLLPEDSTAQSLTQESHSLSMDSGLQENDTVKQCRPMDGTLNQVNCDVQMIHLDCSTQQKSCDSRSFSVDSKHSPLQRDSQSLNMDCKAASIDHNYQTLSADCSAEVVNYDSQSPGMDFRPRFVAQGSETISMNYSKQHVDYKSKSSSVDCKLKTMYHAVPTQTVDSRLPPVKLEFQAPFLDSILQCVKYESQSQNVSPGPQFTNHEPLVLLDSKPLPINDQSHSLSTDCRPVATNLNSHSPTTNCNIFHMDSDSLVLSKGSIPTCINNESLEAARESKQQSKDCKSQSMTTESCEKPINFEAQFMVLGHHSQVQEPQLMPCKSRQLPNDGEPVFMASTSRRQSKDVESSLEPIEQESQSMSVKISDVSMDQEPQTMCFESSLLPLNRESQSMAVTNRHQCLDVELQLMPLNSTQQSMHPKPQCMPKDTESQSIHIENKQLHSDNEHQSLPVNSGQQPKGPIAQSISIKSRPQSMDIESHLIPVENRQQPVDVESQLMPTETRQQSIPILSRQQCVKTDPNSMPIKSGQQPVDGESPSTFITAEHQSMDADPQSMPIEHTQQPLVSEIQSMPITSNQQSINVEPQCMPIKNSHQPIYPESQPIANEKRFLSMDDDEHIENGHQLINCKPQSMPVATRQQSMDAELQPLLIENRQQPNGPNPQCIPVKSRQLLVEADFKSMHNEGRKLQISGKPLGCCQGPNNCDPQSTPIVIQKQSVHHDGEFQLKPNENKHESLCNEPHSMVIDNRWKTIEFESQTMPPESSQESMDDETEFEHSMNVEIRQQGRKDEPHSVPVGRRLQPIDSQLQTISIDRKRKAIDLEPEDLPSQRKHQTMEHKHQAMLIESCQELLKSEPQNIYVESKQVVVDGGSQYVSMESRQETVDLEPQAIPNKSKLLTVGPAHLSIHMGNGHDPQPIDDKHQCISVVKEPQAMPFDNRQQSMYQESCSTPIQCKQQLVDLHPQSIAIHSKWNQMGSGLIECRQKPINPGPQFIPMKSSLLQMNPDPQSILVETRRQPKNLVLQSIPVERRQQPIETEPQSLYTESSQQPHYHEAKLINDENTLQPIDPEPHSLVFKSKMSSIDPEHLSMHMEIFQLPILDHQYTSMHSSHRPMYHEPQTLPIENRQVLLPQKALSAPIKCTQQLMDTEPQPQDIQSRLEVTGMFSGSEPTEVREQSRNPGPLCLTVESKQQIIDHDLQPINVESRQQLTGPDPQSIPPESEAPTMDPKYHSIYKENRQQPIDDEHQSIPMDSRWHPTVKEPQAMAIDNTPQPIYQERCFTHIKCKQQLRNLEPQPVDNQSKQNQVDMHSGPRPIESSQQHMNPDPQSLPMNNRQQPISPNNRSIPVKSRPQSTDHVPESPLIKSTQHHIEGDSHSRPFEGKQQLVPELVSIEVEPNPIEPQPEDMPIKSRLQAMDADIQLIPIKSVQHHEQSELPSSHPERRKMPGGPELQFAQIETKLLLEEDTQDSPIKSKQLPMCNEPEAICAGSSEQPKDHEHQSMPWKNSSHPVDKVSLQVPSKSSEPALTSDPQSLPFGNRQQHMDSNTEYKPLVCQSQPEDKDPQFRAFVNSQQPVDQQLQSFCVTCRHQYMHHEPKALPMGCKPQNVKSLQLQSHHTDCKSTHSELSLNPDADCSLAKDSTLQPCDCTIGNLQECSGGQADPSVQEQLEMSTGLQASSFNVPAASSQLPSPGLQPQLKQEQKPQKETLPSACLSQCTSHNMCRTPQPLVNQIVLNFLEQQKPSPREHESSPCASQCTSQSACHNAPPVVKQIVVIFLEQQKEGMSENPESPLISQCTSQTVYSIPHSGGNQDLIARLLKHVKHPKDESQERPCSSSCTVHKCPSPKLEVKQSPENLTVQLKKELNLVLEGPDASQKGMSHDLDTLPVEHSTSQHEKQHVETFFPTQESLESTNYSQKPWEEQSITFEDIAICFSKEEWEILEDWQKTLYKDVMKDSYDALVFIDCPVPKPGILSWIHQQHNWECDRPGIWNEREATSRSSCVSSLGGNEWLKLNHDACEDFIMDPDMQDICAPSDDEVHRSTHLGALMKLVKAIPEFLFGGSEMTSSPSPTESVDKKAWLKKPDSDVKSETTSDSSHLPVLEDRLTELWSAPSTPSSIVQANMEESRLDTGGKRPSTEGDVSVADTSFPYLVTCQSSLSSLSNSSTPNQTLPRDHERGTPVIGAKNTHEEELHTSRVSDPSGPVAHMKEIPASKPSPCNTPARTSTPSTIRQEGEIMRPESGRKRLSGEMVPECSTHLPGLVHGTRVGPVASPCVETPRPGSGLGWGELGGGRTPETVVKRSSTDTVLQFVPYLSGKAEHLKKMPAYVRNPPASSAPPTNFMSMEKEPRRLETGVKRPFREDPGPGKSPLHGLVSCLNDISVGRLSPHKVTATGRRGREWRKPEVSVRQLNEEAEAAPDTAQLPALINCLKKTPVHLMSPAQMSGASLSPRQRESRRADVGLKPLYDEAEVTPSSPSLLSNSTSLSKKPPVNLPSLSTSITSSTFSPAFRDPQRTEMDSNRQQPNETTRGSPSYSPGFLRGAMIASPRMPSLVTSSTATGASPGFREMRRLEMASRRPQVDAVTSSSFANPPGTMRYSTSQLGSTVTSTTSSSFVTGFRDQRRLDTVNNRPYLDVRAEIEASNAHLQSLANCWKEIPAYRHSPSQVLNTRGEASTVAAEKEVRRPDVGTKRSYMEAESPPDLASRMMKKQLPTPSQSPTSSRSSPSMSPGGREPRRPERDVTVGNTHLHGLMNCLKDIPLNRSSMTCPAPITPPHVASGKASSIGFSPASSKAGSAANRFSAAVPSSMCPTGIRHEDGQQRRPEMGARRVNPDGSISVSSGRGDEEQRRPHAGVRRLQTGVTTGSSSEKHLQEMPSPQHDNSIGTIRRHNTGSESSRSLVRSNQGLKKWCRTGLCLHPVKNPGEDIGGQSPVALPHNLAGASSLPSTERAQEAAEGRMPSVEDREKMIHHYSLPNWLRTSKNREGVATPGLAGDASSNSHLHGLMKLTRHLPVSESSASSRTMQEIALGMVDRRPMRRSQVAFSNEASPLRELNDSNAGSGDSVMSDDNSWSSENAEPSYSAISRLQKVVSGFSENECISPFTAVKPSAASRSVQEASTRRMYDRREAGQASSLPEQMDSLKAARDSFLGDGRNWPSQKVPDRKQNSSSTPMSDSHCIDLTEEEELARVLTKPVRLPQAAESESRPAEYIRNVDFCGPPVSSSQCIDLTEDEDMVCDPPKAKTSTPKEDTQGSPAPENMISPVNKHLSGLEKLLKEVPMMELGNFSNISNKYARNVNWRPKNSPSNEPQELDSHVSEKHSNI